MSTLEFKLSSITPWDNSGLWSQVERHESGDGYQNLQLQGLYAEIEGRERILGFRIGIGAIYLNYVAFAGEFIISSEFQSKSCYRPTHFLINDGLILINWYLSANKDPLSSIPTCASTDFTEDLEDEKQKGRPTMLIESGNLVIDLFDQK